MSRSMQRSQSEKKAEAVTNSIVFHQSLKLIVILCALETHLTAQPRARLPMTPSVPPSHPWLFGVAFITVVFLALFRICVVHVVPISVSLPSCHFWQSLCFPAFVADVFVLKMFLTCSVLSFKRCCNPLSVLPMFYKALKLLSWIGC